MRHMLKCWPEFFRQVCRGEKTFELRSEVDRTFSVGDSLMLLEYNPDHGYTGDAQEVWVNGVLRADDLQASGLPIAGALSHGVALMSISRTVPASALPPTDEAAAMESGLAATLMWIEKKLPPTDEAAAMERGDA